MKKNQFLLIGRGRLAQHLGYYFQLKSIPYITWDRTQPVEELLPLLRDSLHILLAISDSALTGFFKEFRNDSCWVHFSGAVHVDGMISAHPLMSFGPEKYVLDIYEKIHFTMTGTHELSAALPGLRNSFSVISPEQKPLYHALCVLGGNFPVLLWQKMVEGFAELGLPENAHTVYLEKVLANFLQLGPRAFTGPLARKDFQTIEKNLTALKTDPYKKIYSAFVEAHL